MSEHMEMWHLHERAHGGVSLSQRHWQPHSQSASTWVPKHWRIHRREQVRRCRPCCPGARPDRYTIQEFLSSHESGRHALHDQTWYLMPCLCDLNHACLLVSIHTSLSSPARLCLQKMKRHDSRTPSSELIKYSFHQKMKWNEMNCTVSNYKWNEMKHQKKILIINLTVSSKLDIWKTDIFTRNLISSKPYPICGKLKIMWSKHIFF
jgi:hypothetical protein